MENKTKQNSFLYFTGNETIFQGTFYFLSIFFLKEEPTPIALPRNGPPPLKRADIRRSEC